MKRKDIKEALGRKSRQIGIETDTKIMRELFNQPLTFGELHKRIGVSKPVLSEHLKKLQKQKLVKKMLVNDKLVWDVRSRGYTITEFRKRFLDDLKQLHQRYNFAIGWENYNLLEKLISNMEKMLKQKGETKNEG